MFNKATFLIVMFVLAGTAVAPIAGGSEETPIADCHDLCVVKRFIGNLLDLVDPVCTGLNANVESTVANPLSVEADEPCVGGAVFSDVEGGFYQISVVDDAGLLDLGAAYRIDSGGVTYFCAGTATSVPGGSTVTVWVLPPGTVNDCVGAAATGKVILTPQ